jgi:hypothetical protein
MEATAEPGVSADAGDQEDVGGTEKNHARTISDDELELLLSPDKDLLCAITGELFEDPVVTDDGHTYERAAIEEWFHSQKLAGRAVTSPLTNVKLKNTRVVQNNKVKSDVIKWCEDLAKRAKDLADEYPGSAVDLLERALEYHPDNADTWLQLAHSHEDQATEGWRASAFRCRFNHAQAKDSAEDYKGFLEWCEANDHLAEFEAAVLRIAEPKCPELAELLAAALERTGGETLDFEDAPRRAQMNSTDLDASFKKAYQPRDEMPEQRIYSCKIKRTPPTIDYATKKEQPALLCVSSEGVTVIDAIAKLQSPIICRYTFHQILSWTVAKDTFSFHVLVRVNGTNQKEAFEFMTPEGKAISLRLKEHVNVLLLERSRERRSRARPRKVSAPAAAAAAAAEETSLSGMVLDEFYGVPEDDTDTQAIPTPTDVPAGPLANTASAAMGGGAVPELQGGYRPERDDGSSDALFSTASIPSPLSASPQPPASLPPAVRSSAADTSRTVDRQQVRELALVFPNETDAELERVLLAADGDFEAAAATLLDKPLVRAGRFRQSGWGPGLAGAVRSSGLQLDLGGGSSSSSADVDVIEGAMAIMSAAMVPCPPSGHDSRPLAGRHRESPPMANRQPLAADIDLSPPAATRAAPPVANSPVRRVAVVPASMRHPAGNGGESRTAAGTVASPLPIAQAQAAASTASAAESVTVRGLASEPSSPAGSSSSLMEQLVALPVPTGALATTSSTRSTHVPAAGRKSTGGRGRSHSSLGVRGAVDVAVSMPMPAE